MNVVVLRHLRRTKGWASYTKIPVKMSDSCGSHACQGKDAMSSGQSCLPTLLSIDSVILSRQLLSFRIVIVLHFLKFCLFYIKRLISPFQFNAFYFCKSIARFAAPGPSQIPMAPSAGV